MTYNPPQLLAEKDAAPDILYAIGLLVATAAQVDFDLGCQVIRFVSHDRVNPYASPVVAGMDFKVKLSIIRVMANQLEEEDCERAQKLCDELQDLYQRRNDVAHLPMMGRKGNASLFMQTKRSAKGGVVPPRKPFTATQIKDWARRMEWAAIQLSDHLDGCGLPGAKSELVARARG
jgi:hypothetical protein